MAGMRLASIISGVVVGYIIGVYVTVGIPCALTAPDDACIPIHGFVTVPLSMVIGGRLAARAWNRHVKKARFESRAGPNG